MTSLKNIELLILLVSERWHTVFVGVKFDTSTFVQEQLGKVRTLYAQREQELRRYGCFDPTKVDAERYKSLASGQ